MSNNNCHGNPIPEMFYNISSFMGIENKKLAFFYVHIFVAENYLIGSSVKYFQAYKYLISV